MTDLCSVPIGGAARVAPPPGRRGVILSLNLGGKLMEEFLNAEERKCASLQAHIPAAKEFPLLIVSAHPPIRARLYVY